MTCSQEQKILPNKPVHAILGASGSMGGEVMKNLLSKGINVKSSAHEGIDAENVDQLTDFLFGCSHLYMCIGLPYVAELWERKWPAIMRSIILATKRTHTRVIFLDNAYMYGPPQSGVPITEEHEQKPTSAKGRARKIAADLLMRAHKKGTIKAVIARSSDFYGPRVFNTPLYASFLERMLKGLNPVTVLPQKIKHSYSFTPDNAEAMVRLALDDDAYGQVWHLPVSNPISVEEITKYFNNALSTSYTLISLPKFIIKLLAIFSAPIREYEEMKYIFESDYIFSDKKFMNRYQDFQVTSYSNGIKKMVKSFM